MCLVTTKQSFALLKAFEADDAKSLSKQRLFELVNGLVKKHPNKLSGAFEVAGLDRMLSKHYLMATLEKDDGGDYYITDRGREQVKVMERIVFRDYPEFCALAW